MKNSNKNKVKIRLINHNVQTTSNKILASSHYSIQPRNRSFDINPESRIQTGNKSTDHTVRKLYGRINKSQDLTAEPEAVIKIIRNKKNKRRKNSDYLRIRSNSNNKLLQNYNSHTKNIYSGLWNSVKKKKYPWKPNGLRGAFFRNQS